MNINPYPTTDYRQEHLSPKLKNKPNQTQFKSHRRLNIEKPTGTCYTERNSQMKAEFDQKNTELTIVKPGDNLKSGKWIECFTKVPLRR